MATTVNSIDTRIPRAGVNVAHVPRPWLGVIFFPDKGAHAFHRALSIVSTRVSAYTLGGVGGLEILGWMDFFVSPIASFVALYLSWLVDRS